MRSIRESQSTGKETAGASWSIATAGFIRANGRMTLGMAGDLSCTPMEICSKGTLERGKPMGREFMFGGNLVKSMRESGAMDKGMVKVSGKTPKMISTKGLGSATEPRGMAFIFGTMEIDMKENGNGVLNMDRALISLLMEIFTSANIRMESLMGMGLIPGLMDPLMSGTSWRVSSTGEVFGETKKKLKPTFTEESMFKIKRMDMVNTNGKVGTIMRVNIKKTKETDSVPLHGQMAPSMSDNG